VRITTNHCPRNIRIKDRPTAEVAVLLVLGTATRALGLRTDCCQLEQRLVLMRHCA
jgi:hypothetical protein